MRISLDFTKSAQKNAEDYYNLAKKSERKALGAEASIRRMEKELTAQQGQKPKEKPTQMRKNTEWYEEYNWFFTPRGELAIGGRSAKQNEAINSKYFEERDMFFHADIFGASVVVLKGGASASKESKELAAQFAACFSSGWAEGTFSLNVYALGRKQVSKSKQKGSLGTGSFLLEGEREWYKNVPLSLCAYLSKDKKGEDRFTVAPQKILAYGVAPENHVIIAPGTAKKSDAAKAISKKLGFADIDYIMQHLPAGGFSV